MKKILRTSIVGAALVASLALAGCSSNGHSEQESFDFSGDTLNVVHDNSYMNVSVSSHDTEDEVVVDVNTQTLGQSPETPAWSLSNNILNLGSPCGGSVVGYCEGSYSIQVPEGTEVLINGRPTSVG
ncbi:MAG: hypothetical protein Q4G21_11275 [Dermabacter sp.]|nr:hypothetical protein [Dermabacter sp.]